MIWVDYIVFVLSIILVFFIAVQQSQDNIKDAFSGEKSDLFKDQKVRGIELFLMRSTFVFAIALVGFVLLSLYLHK